MDDEILHILVFGRAEVAVRHHHFHTYQGAVGAAFTQGIPEQVDLVHPWADHITTPAEEEIARHHVAVAFLHQHGAQGDVLCLVDLYLTILGARQMPAAAQQAGLRRMGGMPGFLVGVVGNEQVDLLAGTIRPGEDDIDVIIGPELVQDLLGDVFAPSLPALLAKRLR